MKTLKQEKNIGSIEKIGKNKRRRRQRGIKEGKEREYEELEGGEEEGIEELYRKISLEEVQKVLGNMKNGKAEGEE